MPEVDACIDDVQHANYSIPALQHGHRKLVLRDRVSSAFDYEHVEEDYVDARTAKTYTQPDVEFNVALNVQQLACLGKINALLRRLVDGGSVSDKQLKNVLTAEQYDAYKESLTAVMHSSEITYSNGMPYELQTYKQMLREADFQHNKFVNMSTNKRLGHKRFKQHIYERTKSKVDKLYELALEQLDATYNSADPMLRHEIETWMDRELDFDAGPDRKIGIDAETIPRVRGSKSKNALDSGLPKLSKRLKRKECQLLALKDAAWVLAFKQPKQVEATDEVPTVRSEKLKWLLQLNDDDDLY